MQYLEVSCAVRPIQWPLGVKWLIHILIIKANDMRYFSSFILIKYSTCLGQIYCPSSGVSTLYTQQ